MSHHFRHIVVLYLLVQLVLSFLHDNSHTEIGAETPFVEAPKGENGLHTNETNLPEKLKIRKCCEENEYFNSETGECVGTTDLLKFTDEIKEIANATTSHIEIFSKKMEDCADVRTAEMMEGHHYHIMENGEIHDQNLGISYSHAEYCLEIVGADFESSSLVLVYCSSNKNTIPKCCPPMHFDNTRENDCTPYDESDKNTEASRLNLYLDENSELGTSNLVCMEPTITVDLNETYFQGSYLCINKTEQCLHWDKYCIDNMLENGSTELIQVSHLCPELFVKKCCPEGEGLDDSGCVKLSTQSPYIKKTLNNFMYYVSGGVINYDSSSACSPVIIDKYPDSDMSWSLDTEGNVVFNKKDGPIITRKFCVDDFVKDNESTPVLKTCSEEVKEYAPVSSLENYPQNVLGKCCPPSQHMHAGECVDYFNDTSSYLEDSELTRFNISHLLFIGFPNCESNHKYHSYILGEDLINDYVVIAEQRRLKVIDIMNHCKFKETEVAESSYCLEYTDNNSSGNEFKLHAFICIAEQKIIHSEKSPIVISLVSLSCVALIASFFILLCTRVRRGMFTVRKVNTLAGRILMSYVISLLIGYVALGVSYLVDFKGETEKCFALTGVLQFFMIAAFCWNTSICLEGFLLTMDIRTSEHRRYIFHSLGAWGIAGSITALTLLIDSFSEHLPCSVITPRIGVERCFFSNNMALLLYFYLPITITVMLNAVLLLASKILRNAQLKKLENNMGSLKEQKSAKQNKSKRTQVSTRNSGLRTHQSRNMWMEYFRLVVWSGGTWLMEIVGTLVTMFGGISGGEWYTYLWYLPVSFNCLRGLGIFFLILSTSEYLAKYDRLFKILNCRLGKSAHEHEINSHQYKKSAVSVDMNTFDRSYSANDERKQSNATITTDITIASSLQNESPNPGNHNLQRSISQVVHESANSLNDSVDSAEIAE